MIVAIDFEAIKNKAHIRASKMVSNGLYSRFGLNYQKRVAKALLGCIGELGFEEYLKQQNINYSKDDIDFTLRNSDEFDFLIYEKKIDIKVAKKSTHQMPNDKWTYGYPKEQNPATKDFVIVGWVDFNVKEVGFYGWITGRQISEYSIVTRNTFAGYPYLTPNHEFRWGDLNKNFDRLLSLIRSQKHKK